MARRRAYTQTQKAHAVAQATVTSAHHAADTLGIPRSTLREWINEPEYADLRVSARELVVEQFWVGIQVGIHEVVASIRDPDASLRDKAVALGILYDKHALLTGGATTRSEARDITGTLSDAELVATLREAERLTASGGAEEAAPAAPEG